MSQLKLRSRVNRVTFVFASLLLVLCARLHYLCVIEGPRLKALAEYQHYGHLESPVGRGRIVDRNAKPLALTRDGATIAVRPSAAIISDSQVEQLAEVLDRAAPTVRKAVYGDKPFIWLHRSVNSEQASAVEALDLPGIEVMPTKQRFYVRGPVAAQLIGFAGIDLQGLEGIEHRFDKYLRGERELHSVPRDARGNTLLPASVLRQLPRQGAIVELTIDADLQQVVEDALVAAVMKYRAVAGVAIVLDPRSGEILAMANAPLFDPNHFRRYDRRQYRNRAIADNFEPGSTFKPITVAAAIEDRIVTPQDEIYCEDGELAIGPDRINDHESYGVLPVSGVITHSSNIGIAKIAARVGKKRLIEVIKAFGFGDVTGVDLPGEAKGLMIPSQRWREINLATASFGQGIAVTALQLVRAYGALANGGKLMKPYVVRRVIDEDVKVLVETTPQLDARPISKRTADIVTEMLMDVVESGTGTAAAIEGVSVAGKTGTAQRVDPSSRGYARGEYISSFVGFVPADDPHYSILVAIDRPREAFYGGVVAAPVFREIAEYALDIQGLRVNHRKLDHSVDIEDGGLVRIWSADPGSFGMPSFIGMSMREARLQAQRAGWQPELQGTGFVINQDPPPGAPRGEGSKLKLFFSSALG